MARITLVPSSNSTSPRVESTIFFPSTHNDTPPSCRDVSPSPKTLRSVAYGSLLRSLLSHLSMRKIKRALASLPLRVEVCVCAIIESHRNRITHGYRDGRETMVVSFANRCQGGFLCSFPSLGIVIRGKEKKRKKEVKRFVGSIEGCFTDRSNWITGDASISGERCYDRCSVRFGLYLLRD